MTPPLFPKAGRIPRWFWQRWSRGFRTIRQVAEWSSFAGDDWAERIMDEEITDRQHAKQGRKIARWTLERGDGKRSISYLKRFYVLPRTRGILASLFPHQSWGPGLEEWDNLQRAASLGIPVPRPLAAGDIVLPGGRLQSFLVVEELKGMLALHEAIPFAQQQLDAAQFSRWKRGLISEMARLTRLLHDRATFHKDLYLCHFFIARSDCGQLPPTWTDRVYLIDFHRLGRHRLSAPWYRVKDLAQLLYSSEIAGITDRDRIAFWKAYRGKEQRRSSILERLIRWKRKRYSRHNQGH